MCHAVLHHVQLSVTPWTVTHQAPLYTGNLQARILEWVAMPSSRISSHPRDRTQVSHIAGELFTKPPGKSKSTGMDSLSLLQQIFPTQELTRVSYIAELPGKPFSSYISPQFSFHLFQSYFTVFMQVQNILYYLLILLFQMLCLKI